jgi:hypothetical protein
MLLLGNPWLLRNARPLDALTDGRTDRRREPNRHTFITCRCEGSTKKVQRGLILCENAFLKTSHKMRFALERPPESVLYQLQKVFRVQGELGWTGRRTER